jgi:predicted amidophosphoribosyltransferase
MSHRVKWNRGNVPDVCLVCGAELKPHERAEAFCDACLRTAQLRPFVEHDKREKMEGVR